MRAGALFLAAICGLIIGAFGGGWIVSTVAARHTAEQRDVLPVPEMAKTGDAKDTPAALVAATAPNPLGDGPDVIVAGKQLFTQMNCAGCHGYDASGGMGPKLTDSYWRYGGSPAAIFTTLNEGRPQGMPAWGRLLPPEKLWQLTAYVGSLGGGVPADQALAGLHGDVSGTVDTKPQNNAAEGGNALEGQ